MKPHRSDHPTPSDVPAASPFASVMTGPLAGAMDRSASMFGKGMRTMQQEGLKFMTRRIEDNMKAIEKFGTCRSVPDFLAAQQQWLSDAARAYNEEWAKCSELMVDIARDESEPIDHAQDERSSRPR
jgi:hypothetical protein